ncbi:MAG: DUF1800 family protein [Burkholderiales bacterium]|nr:DUF1800 family protein [Burkholderiales bacterium]
MTADTLRSRNAPLRLFTLLLAGLLAACGAQSSSDPAIPAPSASSGQVAASGGASAVTQYAASRFAEQASFGAKPALVAEIRQKGFEQWIDEQFLLPASTIDPTPLLGFVEPIPQGDWLRYRAAFPDIAIGAADQLRTRVSWALSQFLVVSDRKVDIVGALYWINFLQRQSLGNYSDLLYQLSIHPAMGIYLDNNQNRPKSAECPNCAPNENFARELMQLFALGVVRLNADGTPQRDGRGAFIETYKQKDVEELARVLTGWTIDPVPASRPNRNYANWARPMVPSTWPPERDSAVKLVLGRSFPAGQSQARDLADAVALLMSHPNIAPFVSTRLIQHLVKSNPSPAYVGRVAARFRDNGQGVAGDMKAVVKAVLLDTEARAGDRPGGGRADDGKLREPFLHLTAVWRGLGCTRVPTLSYGPNLPQGQMPIGAESVFSFYAPTDRAPGSNLLAPEQKIVNASEFRSRLNLTYGMRWDNGLPQPSLTAMLSAGCGVDTLAQAYAASPAAFLAQLAERFFRGTMPPTLRNDIEQLIRQPQWDVNLPEEGALRMLDYALTSPYFGAMK